MPWGFVPNWVSLPRFPVRGCKRAAFAAFFEESRMKFVGSVDSTGDPVWVLVS
jgi:hypothetical protein